MAIQATFQADFSDFQRAVEAAETSLRSFETGASKVEGSLNRMVDSFSGRKVISEAELMMEAVDRLGGVSKLTDAELDRLGSTVGEAAEKMKALGIAVPERMQAVTAQTKEAGKSASAASGYFAGLGSQLAATFTATSLLQFGKHIVDVGDQIQEMGEKTGLSTDEVQGLMAVARSSGTSTDTLISAMQTLQQRIGDQNSGTLGTLKELGIELADLKTKSPYEQLLETAGAVGAIVDPTQRAAMEANLFGGAWRDLTPEVLANMQRISEGVDKMSKADVEALSRAKDSWEELGNTVVVYGGKAIAKIQNLAFEWQRFNDSIFDPSKAKIVEDQAVVYSDFAGGLAATVAPGFTTVTTAIDKETLAADNLAATIEQLDRENAAAIETNKKLAAEQEKAAKELEKWGEAYEKVNEFGRGTDAILGDLDAQLVLHVESLIRAGASVEDLAEAYALTIPQVKAIKTAMDDWTAALEINYASQEEARALQDDLYAMQVARSGTATDIQIANIQRWGDDYKRQLMDAGTMTQETYDLIDRIVAEQSADAMVDMDALRDHSRDRLQETADMARATYERMAAQPHKYSVDTILEFEATARAAQDAADQWSTSFGSAAEDMGAAAEEGSRRVKAAADASALSWSQAMDAVRQGQGTMTGTISAGGPGTMTNYGQWGSPEHKAAIAKAYAAGRYFGPVKTRGGGYGGYGGDSYDVDWEALGMAKGGPVQSGRPYMVGEQGPELFVPSQSGGIVPNGAAGATIINAQFNVNGTGADVARIVSAELTRLMRVGRKWPAV